MDCIFCKIINGDIPCYKVYEDDVVLVFLDINPVSNGHMLIIPKKHFVDVTDIESDVMLHIFEIAKDMKKLVQDKLGCEGVTFSQNNGICQEVKHYHLHVIPVYDGGQDLIDVGEIFKKIKED